MTSRSVTDIPLVPEPSPYPVTTLLEVDCEAEKISVSFVTPLFTSKLLSAEN